MGYLPQRIALVYDSVNKWGGAERVLLALHELFPDAPLYTSVYDSQSASWAKVFPHIIPSFLQGFPFAKQHRDYYPFLTPLAFESLDFSKYQAVISVTSSDAKGIITSPATFHLCYCLTPTRYYWSHYDHYKDQIPLYLKSLSQIPFMYGKRWDMVASSRPDAYLAISHTVKDRIQKYYHRPSQVVFPPVDTHLFSSSPLPENQRTHFLYVGRMVSYKNPELIVKVFNQLGLPLVMVGDGPLLAHLKHQARNNIRFPGFVNDSDLADLYRHAKALLFVHEEDFGISAVEAQSTGTPVIGLNRGGVSETVIPGKTGVLLPSVDPLLLASTVKNFLFSQYDVQSIQKHAENFSRPHFLSQFKLAFQNEWIRYKNTFMS